MVSPATHHIPGSSNENGMKAPDDAKDDADAERCRTPGVAGYRRINRAIPYLSLNSLAGFQQ